MTNIRPAIKGFIWCFMGRIFNSRLRTELYRKTYINIISRVCVTSGATKLHDSLLRDKYLNTRKIQMIPVIAINSVVP